MPLQFPVPALSSRSKLEPGIFGIYRPVLLMPDGLAAHLAPEQLDAILAHESGHVVCRDNLTAAVHMYVEALFWFHPLVWWIGAKLMDEREKDCDEAVLRQGLQPRDYAQGIVNVCRAYVESPLLCGAGVSGSSLKRRIRGIMMWRASVPLTTRGKVALLAAALVAFSIPFAIGIVRAQSLPPAPAYTYEVVSIHPSKPGQGRTYFRGGTAGGYRTENTTTMQLLSWAYSVHDYQIAGAPGWATSERYDVSFTPDKKEVSPGPGMGMSEMEAWANRNRQRMQAVLRDRFGLVLRVETREVPIYALVVAKGGPKLAPPSDQPGPYFAISAARLTARKATIKLLTDFLSRQLDHSVIDDTGLTGEYDFKLEWTPDAPLQVPSNEPASDTGGPSIFSALSEQLGLRLVSRKGPAPVYVIEKIEKPGEN